MNKFLTFSLASTVLLVSTGQASAASFKIDDFTFDGSTTSSGGSVSNTFSDGSILGGERAIELNKTSTGGGNLIAETKQCTDIVPPLECMTFSGESGVRGELSIVYGESDSAGLDVTAGGFNDAFRLAVQFADFPTNLDVIVTDTIGNTATYTGQTPSFITVTNAPSELDIAFEDFTGDTVDFSSLDTLEFSFVNIAAATDLEFSLVATENIRFDNDPVPDPDPNPDPSPVPEPTSLISLISLLGFGLFLDWRKKQALN